MSYAHQVNVSVHSPGDSQYFDFDDDDKLEVKVLELDENSNVVFHGVNTMESDNTLEQRKTMVTDILEMYGYDAKILIVVPEYDDN